MVGNGNCPSLIKATDEAPWQGPKRVSLAYMLHLCNLPDLPAGMSPGKKFAMGKSPDLVGPQSHVPNSPNTPPFSKPFCSLTVPPLYSVLPGGQPRKAAM